MVLRYIKKAFYMKRANFSALSGLNVPNRKALDLYFNEPEAFHDRARACVAASLERRFLNERGSTLRFTASNPQAHKRVRDHVLHSLIQAKQGEDGGDLVEENKPIRSAQRKSGGDDEKEKTAEAEAAPQ